jgi:hypothetical protein
MRPLASFLTQTPPLRVFGNSWLAVPRGICEGRSFNTQSLLIQDVGIERVAIGPSELVCTQEADRLLLISNPNVSAEPETPGAGCPADEHHQARSESSCHEPDWTGRD